MIKYIIMLLILPIMGCADIPYNDIIKEQTTMYNIPYIAFIRLIRIESNFNKDAKHINYRNGNYHSIDMGIMQFNSMYYNDFMYFDNDGEMFDPYNPYEAIPVACRYLKRLYKVTNDWKLAFAAYNCGLSRVLENSIPKRTKEYIKYIFYLTD